MADKTTFRTVKNKENPYVLLNKGFVNDDRMSWKAKGLLTYLLSKPDDWVIMVCDLIKKSTDGRESVYNGIKELIACGYVIRNELRDSKGKIEKYEYLVFESPLTEYPHTGNPYTD